MQRRKELVRSFTFFFIIMGMGILHNVLREQKMPLPLLPPKPEATTPASADPPTISLEEYQTVNLFFWFSEVAPLPHDPSRVQTKLYTERGFSIITFTQDELTLLAQTLFHIIHRIPFIHIPPSIEPLVPDSIEHVFRFIVIDNTESEAGCAARLVRRAGEYGTCTSISKALIAGFAQVHRFQRAGDAAVLIKNNLVTTKSAAVPT